MNPMIHMTIWPQYRCTRPVLKMMVLKKDPSTATSPLFPENYVPSFPFENFVMMKPEMIIATIKMANVTKTPEKPKANTLKAIVHSVTSSPSIKMIKFY